MRTDRASLAARVGFVGLALLGATACPGRLRDKDRFLVDATAPLGGDDAQDGGACGDVVARIFVPRCGGACHGPAAPQQGLDLESPGVAARVVGVAATSCAATLADPLDPASSFLYTKLAAKPPCGSQMPLAQLPLSAADATCVLSWIAEQ
jgi:hypothetical protein